MTAQEWDTALHESGHACAALAQGLPVSAVSRVSSDPTAYLGYTSIPITDILEEIDKTTARKMAVMLLCGPAMAEQDLPTWPLSDNKTNDEKLLKVFVEYLGLDARGYAQLVAAMWQLTCTKRFDRLFRVLQTWLECTPTLDPYILTQAMAMVMTWSEG